MAPPFSIPTDVREFISSAFARCNARISARLSRLPTLHETYLDMCLIDTLSDVAAPHITPSGYLIDIDVHFLGQGTHWESWEIADLGLIVNYRRQADLVRTKIALLQSKRLYPRESEFVEDDALSKYSGFGHLFEPSGLAADNPRTFRFDSDCRYRALQVGDNQWKAINAYEDEYSIPVHYLLYHPTSMPMQQTLPVMTSQAVSAPMPDVGALVCRASALHLGLSGRPRNYAPSFADIVAELGAEGSDIFGASLHAFVADDVLDCREGYIAGAPGGSDPGLQRVFAQRGAPITAALRIEITAPEDVDLAV